MRVYYIILLMGGLMIACVMEPMVIPTIGGVATNFYVSTTGSDSNPGTLSQPYKTIQKGVNTLVAGDTLYVRGGTYTTKVTINNSGTSSAPIVISSYPGETAKLDGSGLDPQLPYWTPLFDLYGSYIVIENFELTYPNGRGIKINKDSNTGQNSSHDFIKNLNIHHTWGPGIWTYGDYTTIENNRIWETDLSNSASPGSSDWGSSIAFGDSAHPYYGLNTIVRNNQVYQNYGEGILCMYTDNALIEDNRVWDNWATNIYLDTCSYATIKNNFAYYTNDTRFWRGGKNTYPLAGIAIADEGLIANHPYFHDILAYNNITVNCGYGFTFWTVDSRTGGMVNVSVVNNTFVTYLTSMDGIAIAKAIGISHQNSIIENNLVLVPNGATGYAAGSIAGITFAKNLWSKSPDSSIPDTGDIIGNPLLVNPTQTINLDQITYPLDAAGYALGSSSPAIDKAISIAAVTDDYFGNNRGASPDIGAIEFMGTPSPTKTPVAPTATRTSTPITPTATKTNTPVPPTATKTNTPLTPTASRTNTPVTPTATRTNTPVAPTATNTNTPVIPTPTYTNTPLTPTATKNNS